MTYAELQSRIPNQTQTGGWSQASVHSGDWIQTSHHPSSTSAEWTGLQSLRSAVSTPCFTKCFMALGGTTAALVIWYFDALPIEHKRTARMGGETKKMLQTIEDVFGPSKSDMARILNVSRPMVYHYQSGMEPDLDNKRRLQTIAEVAKEFRWLTKEPLGALLKVEQPEGRTLLEYLSDEHLDVPVVRRLVERNVRDADEALRKRFADAMVKGQNSEERLDIVRERHKAGKPVIVGDPDTPGRVIQIQPNGRRVRGRMEKRRFVPDEK